MNIRNATYHDDPAIKLLLGSLGFKTSHSLLVEQIEQFFGDKHHQLIVYELRKEVIGFVSVHFIPQLSFDGGLMVITYLSVDETMGDHGIDKKLEDYITELARQCKCDRIQVHCMDWRVPVHQFYMNQGYEECSKFFSKQLVYGKEKQL